jgi:NADH pyrophosphatase NudC (nudix superfamily)
MNHQTITQGVASNRSIKQNADLVAVCVDCGNNYIIGKTGTVMGCDKCKHVTRNKFDNTIINDQDLQTYDEDPLTDMEKA